MQIRQRKLLMAGLLAAWALQTLLVYMDDTAAQQLPLDPLALEGRELWHVNNCQVCHQIYGFGGFLGPDLTNAAPRLTRGRLDSILTEGSLQMPAFHFEPPQIDAIQAYLTALDKTGVGQARRLKPLTNKQVIPAIETMVAGGQPMDLAAAAGQELFFKGACVACHTICRSTPLGMITAPDLATVTDRWSDSEIDSVLQTGRPQGGMPPTGLTEAQRAQVLAFFHWLGKHQAELRTQVGDGDGDQGLPWFEYK